ncbi:unnamed protein product [Blepharisma stoltei]|uniref:Uncharacterized protein n=1 Tax=Blepharisma stoltei TaxID=1481888 RepID=A0AAU9K8U3_9CILI|nr:unnamed protein product [Blepharisma stoltei]
MMEARNRKFRQQESRNHEKLLKVILQIYKPKYRRSERPHLGKTPETDTESSNSESTETISEIKLNDYEPPKVKIDYSALEWDQKYKEANKITNGEFPGLIQDYCKGSISLSQLKQRYYSKKKNFNYYCLDDVQSSLIAPKEISLNPKKKHGCIKRLEVHPQRNLSVGKTSSGWNFSTKVNNPRIELSPQSAEEKSNIKLSKTPTNDSRAHHRQQRWCSVSKVDESLITDDYRKYRVTNDRKERDVPNIKYGGRLSAKNMHDILVSSLFPAKNPTERPQTPQKVKDAVFAAKLRIKHHNNSPPVKSRPVTASLLNSRRTNVSFTGFEIRDQIYIPDEL